MSKGFPIFACESCGRFTFPLRLLCPDCGASRWRRTWVDQGVVRETTTLRRAAGRDGFARVGLVQLAEGPRLVTRLSDDLEPGVTVSLDADAGVPCASEL